MEGTLKVESNISEKGFMESLLNMKYSGLQVDAHFAIFAFINSWHIDKLLYYRDLLEDN